MQNVLQRYSVPPVSESGQWCLAVSFQPGADAALAHSAGSDPYQRSHSLSHCSSRERHTYPCV